MLARPRLPDTDGRERDGCWNALERLGARTPGDWLVFGREIAGLSGERDCDSDREVETEGGRVARRSAGALPAFLRVSIF